MIDLNALKEIVRLMVEHDLSEIDLKDGEETVTLKRGVGGAVMMAAPSPQMHMMHAPAPAPAAPTGAAPAPGAGVSADAGPAIESPMVGTFYSAPSPDAKPFVSVGTEVDEETDVCIIEAMKVFNNIKAECRGTIARVLVENGETVEFGQPLFLVKPA